MSSPANDYKSREGLIHVLKAEETIDQPVEVVWALISAFGAIKAWMPAIGTCVVLADRPQPPAYGAVRAVNDRGTVMEETLEIWDPVNHFMSYRLKDGGSWPLKGARGSQKLEPLSSTSTKITWSLDAEEKPSKEVQAILEAQLTVFMRSGLNEAKSILLRPQPEIM